MDSQYPVIDYDSIRQSYSLYALVEKLWGNEVTTNTWRCRFHNEKHERDFKLFEGQDGIWRFKCMSSKCGTSGDVIDFVRMTQSLTHNSEAAQWLTGEDIPTVPVRKKVKQQPPKYYNEYLPQVESYHVGMNGQSVFWRGKGLQPDTIQFFKLGYCSKCPTYPDSPSFTIPYLYRNNLADIKHRLQYPNGSGKYRHHVKGMKNRLFYPQGLFNQDELDFSLLEDRSALLLEGEIKAMFFWQLGYKCAGIPGAESWNENWLRFFKHLNRVYLCLDMDVRQDRLETVADSLKSAGLEVVIVSLPVDKPDDFFWKFGGTIDDFNSCLEYGRAV